VSDTEFFEQHFSLSPIGGVDALGEPAIDFAEHGSRLAAAIRIAPDKRSTISQLARMIA